MELDVSDHQELKKETFFFPFGLTTERDIGT